jgi:membrane protease YdiL (CAAX protease family)
MNNRKIIIFILISFGISWLIWLPNVFSQHFDVAWKHSDFLHILGGLGPFLGAIFTTYIFDKSQGIKAFFKNKIFALPKLKWLLIGFGMTILFFLVPYLFLGVSKNEWIDLSLLGMNSKLPISNPLLIWILWCIFYGLGEESGWRGFLLPELSKKYKIRTSTLLVALVWAPWHLPVFFYDKDLGNMGLGGIIGWVVGLTFGSVLLGWLVKQSKWTLLPVILWHGTFNFFTTSDQLDFLIPSIMSTLVMVVVVWILIIYDSNFEVKIGKDNR